MFHSDVTIIINHKFLVLISFHSHSAFSFPSPSFPRSPRHEYTLNASRPSQLYFRQCHLVTGIYPITPRRCLYCWLLSSLPPSTCEHPWSLCISFLLIHFEISCPNWLIRFLMSNSFSLICLTICIRIVHAVARLLS